MTNLHLTASEPIIEPDLPIIDAHHHLWYLSEAAIAAVGRQGNLAAEALAQTFRKYPRYLFDELRADASSGHNIRASLFVNARAMYRATGPEEMKSVGEVEFVNGIAAMAASGTFGDARFCAGIVGSADLTLGDAIEEVLIAHIRAGGSRYRGIRAAGTVYDEDARIFGTGGIARLLLDPRFRAGFKWLHRLGLSFDVLVLEPQLPDVIDLARAFPETQIILNHAGCPVGVGRYAGQRQQRFPTWRDNMRLLSACENVVVKLGGFGSSLGGFEGFMSTPPASSSELAGEWQPYIETCLDLYGVDRCMFESNYPIDSSTCTYAVLWNAFKRCVAGASSNEKRALFSGTAKRVYRLDI